MDHRCLYGHRVPQTFSFAIKNRQCPICGAPTVTVLGYQIARRLAEQVGLDAMLAFNSIQLIEKDFVLTPVVREETTAPKKPVEVDEIEVPADDGDGDNEPIEAPSGTEELEVFTAPDEPADEQLVARVKVPEDANDPTALPEPRNATTKGTKAGDFGDLEESFFGSVDVQS